MAVGQAVSNLITWTARFEHSIVFQESCTNAERKQLVIEPAGDSDLYCVTMSKKSWNTPNIQRVMLLTSQVTRECIERATFQKEAYWSEYGASVHGTDTERIRTQRS